MNSNFFDLEERRALSLDAFIKVAAIHYGMPEKALTDMLNDYDIEPKGARGPAVDEPLDISMTEVAKRIGLPVKTVGKLQNVGAIKAPITVGCFDFLQSYKKAWGCRHLLRHQLASYSRVEREKIITRPELSSRWEMWVYGQYFYNDEIMYDKNGRMLNPKDRIRIDYIFDQLEYLYKVKRCAVTIQRVRKISEIAKNDRKKVRGGKASERDVMKSRGLPETKFDLFTQTFVFDMYS